MLEYLHQASKSVISAVSDPLLLPTSRTFLLYLVTSYLLALLIHLVENRNSKEKHGPIQDIFPKEVYLHRSAVVDYIYFLCNTTVGAFILLPFVGLGVMVSREVTSLLGGAGATPRPEHWAWTLGLTLVLALVSDFATFFVHLCAHRIPFLWEFHKVHHSAEVMTPVTVYRMHPVDDALTFMVSGLFVGCADAVIRCFVDPNFPVVGLYGVTMFTFLFYLCGYNLRHSHVWLSWGPLLSKVFISPAQHQIHHSKAKQHWNKNFGFMLAVWDYLFGSLYIPREHEHLEFGLGNGQEREYSSVLRLYFLPFAKAYAIFRGRPK
jgi:sterol desaturase/sphingolipid hydroxylase (fatty acid hydroxylase superfamily)